MIKSWESIGLHVPHCKPIVDIGLTWASKYTNRMSVTHAYAVTMFIDPVMRMSWMNSQWEEDCVNKAKKFIVKLMHRKRAEHSNSAYSGPVVAPRPLPHMLGSRRYGIPEAHVHALHHNNGGQMVDQEFTVYVTATLSPQGTSILAFWNASRTMFPTIYSIALDYAPVQASAVPCWAASLQDMEHEIVYDRGSNEQLTPAASTNDTLLRAIAEHECDNTEDTATIYDK
ncbi:uncharacterized protein F5891DRAFT_1198660 [Suillus fuscotomentosus]|uniref:Uncharacterized protein n=1 Tax=Suillus fuscotomentosus TaxID=1912939 RepID=A0AAD4DQA3_9AGAM|nr:uncharacterized protein F5891DRAFT_1198660 [Suillus fuscotomentosus]KAG1889592.1 hypothetical protein F5891DRAFT_1198660 [Suillus fuscotomentosus]